MSDYTIHRYDGKVIQFQGELIGSVEDSVQFRDDQERKFYLKTYATGSGYVAQIDFASEVEGELAGTIIEMVDSLHDVQNFFFVFDSQEVLPTDRGLNQEQVTDRTRLANKLNATYEKLTYAMLDLVEAYVEKQPQTNPHVRNQS